ncbi:MAG: hypothetical protein R2941_07385 [Desulfobacterales bacterium]
MSFLQQQALILMQACFGVISPNRMVSISALESKILITIILENESAGDMEEIDDLSSEFEALQSCHIDFEISVEILRENLNWPDESTIVVF